jgi:C1A family cysteine protease
MQKYWKGHVRRPDKDHLIQLSNQAHGAFLRNLQVVPPPPRWDSRELGFVGPVKNQSECGSCWDFSGTGVIEIAYNKAGIGGGANAFVLSEEYSLSCYHSGRCGGDDNTRVLEWAQAHGLPLASDYGPYTAAPGTCSYNPTMALYKIDGWGFADSNGRYGVTPIADIKAAIMHYGAVGCAVVAGPDGSAFEAYSGGVFADSGLRAIDHDVILVGWDDATGSWILRNSWGPDWGEGGYMRIAYGANLVGTESVWAAKHTTGVS